MKHFKQFLLVLLIVMANSVGANAYDFEENGIYYNIVSKSEMTCEVTTSPTYNYSGNIVIPATVTSSGKTFSVIGIERDAFDFCISLKSVEIQEGVKQIGTGAFWGCYFLESLTIPNSVDSIGIRALKDCESLKEIKLPNKLRCLNQGVLEGCSALKSIEIPNSVINIEAWAFAECESLESISIPNSVVTIYPRVFTKCSSLVSIEIPNSVTMLGEGAFEYCPKLKNVTLSKSITNIGAWLFQECPSLEKIIIPENVTEVRHEAFKKCTALKEIVSLNTTPPSVQYEAFDGVEKLNCTVKVPVEAVEAYQNANGWKSFWDIIPLDCAAPIIDIENGKLIVHSETENAVCHTTIICEDQQSTELELIELNGIYRVTSYATAEGLEQSKVSEALIAWVNPTIDELDKVVTLEAKKAVLIRSNGNSIIVLGTERGERIDLYTIGGTLLGSATAEDNETIIPCNVQKGEVVVIKYGDTSVKYLF